MFIYGDYIEKSICKNLINVFENSNNKEWIKDNFTTMTQVILYKNDPILNPYLIALTNVLKKYKIKYKYCDSNQHSWDLFNEIKIQKYNPNESYFGWHCENDGGEGVKDRFLVFTTYLNDVKHKGETEFLYQKMKIKPKEGRTVIFPSSWTHTHRGNSSLEIKYIITGWYTYVYQ